MKLKYLMASFFLIAATSTTFSQSGFVTGSLVDEVNEPVSSATITLKQSKEKSKTKSDGSFALSYNGNSDTLIITHIGFKALSVPINNSTKFPLRIVLSRTESTLEEVVVNTGYQKIPKERATGAFEYIGNELFNRNVSSDVISRLEGLSPGILMDKRNGNLQRLTIRGRSTIFGDTQPLIVVDNFPYEGDINNINPNDVESVTILKDAAAASIWGVRSGNGVIVITTKTGKVNQRVSIGFNSNLTIGQKPDIFYLPAMSTSDFINVEKDLFAQGYYTADENNSSYPILSPVVELLIAQRDGIISEAQANSKIDALRSLDVRNDMNKYLFENSISQQYSLNVSGGTEKMSYYISGGFDKSRNVYGAMNERKSLRSRMILTPVKNLTVNLSLNTSYIEARDGRPAYNSIRAGRKQLYPYAQFADEAGNALPIVYGKRMGYVDTVGSGLLLDWKYRPLEQFSSTNGKTASQDIMLDLQTNYKLSKGLIANIQYQYQGIKSEYRGLNSVDFYTTRDLINNFSQIIDGKVIRAVPIGDILKVSNSNSLVNSVRGNLTYNKRLGFFAINSLAGVEYRNFYSTSHQFTEYGFNNELLTFTPVDNVTEFPLFTGSKAKIPSGRGYSDLTRRFTSVFGNTTISFRNKYFASGSIRKDASNIFGVDANQRGVPLWSTGLAWNLHDEEFYRNSILPFLRLSTTFGYNGNIDNTLSAYPILLYVNIPDINNTPYGILLNPPNDKLRWERVKTFNFSLDFKTRKNLVNGNISYYLKKGVDLIGNSSIDPTTGILSFKGNIANMTTNGFEANVVVKVLDKSVKWNSTILFSRIINKVTKYERIAEVANGYIGTETTITPLEGKPLYGVYSYKWGGLDPEDGDPQGVLNKEVTKNYSDILNNSSLEEFVYHGPGLPTSFGMLRNDISWNKISFSFNIAFKLGYYFRRNSINYNSLFSNWAGHPDYSKRWERPGDETVTNVPSVPSITSLNYQRDAFYTQSEVLVEKADNIRFHDINLAYSIGPSNSRLPFSMLQIYLYAKDLGIIWRANKHGIDPDYQQVLPFRKSISIGIRANF